MNQQNWRQAAPGAKQLTEAQIAQLRYQQQQQHQMRMNQRAIPQQQVRPQQQVPVGAIKRPTEDIIQIKTVKQRLEESLAKDHTVVANIDHSSFKSKQDILDRLLPFHVYQIIEIDYKKYDKLATSDIIENAKKAIEKSTKVLDEQPKFYEKFYMNLADSVCHQKGRK